MIDLKKTKKKIQRKIGQVVDRVAIHFPVEDGGNIELESRDCVEIKIVSFDEIKKSRRKKWKEREG